jgi:predicted O-methyltransferase YrrM
MHDRNSEQLENYFHSLCSGTDDLLVKSREAAVQLGLQRISLGDLERNILKMFVHSNGCQKFVEIGTLTGASGLAILSAMPAASHFWTFEKEPRHAALAQPILAQAALSGGQACDVVVGDAQEKLKTIEKHGPFDGIFIDGNKSAYGEYLKWAEKNIRKGGLIVADNVFLGGGVLGHPTDRFSEKQISVMKEFNKRLFQEDLFRSCLIPTSEGLLVAVKLF